VTAATSVQDGPVRVLVCDDDALFAEALSTTLAADQRLEVIGVAHDGREALEIIRTDTNIDVVLLDVDMPRMNGIETLRALRAAPTPSPAVIILTGATDNELIKRIHSEGPDGFLRKTVDPQEVINGVLIIRELVRAAPLTTAERRRRA
jgi:DNA-binding NarL/FixJ family response regulator